MGRPLSHAIVAALGVPLLGLIARGGQAPEPRTVQELARVPGSVALEFGAPGDLRPGDLRLQEDLAARAEPRGPGTHERRPLDHLPPQLHDRLGNARRARRRPPRPRNHLSRPRQRARSDRWGGICGGSCSHGKGLGASYMDTDKENRDGSGHRGADLPARDAAVSLAANEVWVVALRGRLPARDAAVAARAMVLILALLPGCRLQQPLEQPVDVALALVRQAQGAGIDPQRLHLPLIDDLRQLEAARALAQRKLPAARVAEGFQGARPNPALGSAERARRYAEQASRRLQRILQGTCQGQLEELGRQLRLGALLKPLPEAPPGFEQVRQRAQEELADSRLVAVRCEQGSIGMLLVRRDTTWRVVDVVPTGRGGGPPSR